MASVILGVVLVLVALQLARCKRRAWFVAVVFFAIAAADHVLKGPHPIVVLYSVAMLAALIWHREAFSAQPDPGSLRRRAVRAGLPRAGARVRRYFFSSAGDAMIAFAYVSGYALVAADPIGAPGLEGARRRRVHRLLPSPRLARRLPGRP